jgi:PAS domain S-box-containing protein
VLDDNGEVEAIIHNANDVTAQYRAEAALRESEERQAFLLKLSDALRPLSDPTEVKAAATRALGEHLRVTRAQYYEVDPSGEYFSADGGYTDGAPPVVGRYRMDDFGEHVTESYNAGRTLAIADVSADSRVPAEELAAYDKVGFRAFVGVPLVKGGRLQGTLGIAQATPRAWTAEEIALAEETAERTWAAVERARAEAALRESEARLRRILDTETVGVVFFDQAGTVLEANTAFWRMTGYTPADAQDGALSWRSMTPPEWVAVSEAQMEALAATGRIGPYEKEYQRKDGTRRWLLFAGRDLGDGTIVEFAIDVSERKRLEAERERLLVVETVAAERAALLQSMLDALPDGVILADERLSGVLVNPAYRALYRLDLDPEFFRRPAEERARIYHYRDLADRPIPREAWPATRAQQGELIGGNDAIEARATALDGTTLELSFTAGPIRNASGRITGTVTTARDIRARRVMEIERERLLRERQELLEAVVRAQEEERRHLARELHDEIGQALTGLQLQLAAFARGQDGRAAALEAEQIVRDLTARVSTLSVDLRPSALDTLGVLPALLSHVERFQARTGLRIDLRHDGLDRRFPPPVEITAYRVVQEALTNIVRHSGARGATVQLLADDGTLTLAVRDDGRGFDLHASRRTGGLSGMRERVELLGGTLTIDTAPDEGTLITAELPLHDGTGAVGEEDDQ